MKTHTVSALLLCLVLGGCGTQLPKRYEVAVGVPCKVEKPAAPKWATASLPPDANIFEQVKALLAERRQRIAYEALLEAAIAGCNKPVGSAAPLPS